MRRMRPKKSLLMPIAIGMALVGAYLLLGKSASAATNPPAPGPAPGPQPQPQPQPQQDHVLGTSGGMMNTKQAQIMLKTLGPVASSTVMASLVCDGIWGLLTQAAVLNFQNIKGLSNTGEVDPPTGASLVHDYNLAVSQGAPVAS